MDVTFEKVGSDTFLVIRAKLPKKPAPSASGKSLMLATTNGNRAVDGLKFQDQEVILGLNAYIKKEG